MSKSLRERILEKDDRQSELIEVPQWGEKLKVVGMSAKERARLLRRITDTETGEMDIELMYPLLIIATAHDPDSGEKVFTEDDIDALNDKSGGALEVLGSAASRLSGMAQAEVNDMGKPSSQITTALTDSEDSPST